MRLWVANGTKKNIHFHFRIPEVERLLDVKLPIGTNVTVWKPDMNGAECEAIINQLESQLNAVKAGSKPDGYVGVVYSVDKPVEADAIVDTVNKNDDVLSGQGAQIRQDAAIATHGAVARAVSEGAGVDPDNLAKLTVSVEEENKPGEEKKVDQTTEVVREGESDGTRDKPSTKRRRR